MAPPLKETQDPTNAHQQDHSDDVNGPVPDPFLRYGKPLPESWIPLCQKPMGTPTRKLKVVTIGAGVSAMGLAWKIHHDNKMDDIMDYTIYETNDDIGGTWLVNTYPGVAW